MSELTSATRSALLARLRHALTKFRWPVMLAWLLIIGVGFIALVHFKAIAGSTAVVPANFSATGLAPNPHGCTLVMFAHPRCSCTRSSLAELAVIVARAPDLAPIQVIFSAPAIDDEAWTNSDLVRQANRMIGVQVKWDAGQHLTNQLGVRTSGHALLYDATGQLIYSGGVTSLRGHAGWSSGHTAILAGNRGQHGPLISAPVFGCSLRCAPTAPAESQ
ncbi:hypothetical protein ETAA8_63570 [Anatilimnocola aggregata]|uniref:RedB protein n=1 Tax=Anatilimnocola aggregata TaxID=2528021 RepID=A0A517YLW7_9BACT|nr:hypothetical protein [Anatilimnocola aggregata]QDU31204.1 hypothetical protein ETAA8_63570 [Anatilimnocola aggregata]